MRLYELANNRPQLYCDMDGVVADFEGYVKNSFNLEKIRDNDWAEKIPENVFAIIPPKPDAFELWNYIKDYDPIMLTAAPSERKAPEHYARAAQDKTEWMAKYFGLPADRMRVVQRQDKKKFSRDGRTKKQNILIDDYIKNIEEFRSGPQGGGNGGIAIHHTSAMDTIRQLQNLNMGFE